MVLPVIALAATGDSTSGLVPCGVGSDPKVATECQACNVVQLIQNLIMFMIGLAVPIAMAMFAYAGFLYFTSGAGGGNENISKARNIFKNTFIGFVLALSSWLIVNTILYTVLNHDQYPDSSWFHIDCTTRDPGSMTIGQVILNHLNQAPAYDPTKGGVSQPSCTTGTLKQTTYGSYCLDDNGQVIGSPTIASTVSRQGVGNCSAAALQGTWGTNASAMSCIAQQESACGASPYSGVDVASGGQAISVGLYQINLSANKMFCGSQTFNCPSAFSSALTGKNKNVSVSNADLYNQCVQAALNNSCNTQTAQYIYKTGGIRMWSTAGACGY